MEKIRAHVHWKLRPNEVTISTKGHHIYLGSQFQAYVNSNIIERMNFLLDSKRILLEPDKVGDFKIMRSHNERNNPQVAISIPHSVLGVLAKFSGRHLGKITTKGIEIDIS